MEALETLLSPPLNRFRAWTWKAYEVPLSSPVTSSDVAGALTSRRPPPLQVTTYSSIRVPLPVAASQVTVARPLGPLPAPSSGMDACTPVGAAGTAHGVTGLEGAEALTPSPTEFTPV